MRYALLLATILLIPTGGWAGAWSKGCQFSGGNLVGTAVGTPSNTNKRISKNEFGCYRFIPADGIHNSSAAAHMNGFMEITATSALIVFDPDPATINVSAARVIPHVCAVGAVTAANPEQSCVALGGANGNPSLDGTEGTASVQNAALRVGPGIYYFEIQTACAAGDTCQIAVKGEDSE